MHFSTVEELFRRSVIFDLTIASAALLGVGRRGGLSSHIYPAVSSTVGICPVFWLFSFTRCIVQHLGLSEKSQGICSFLGGSTSACCVQHFLEEAPKLLENPMSLSVQYVLSPSYLLGVLRSCIWVDSHLTALLWWSFCGLFLIP